MATTDGGKLAFGMRFGINAEGATGDFHLYGDIPRSVRALLEETAAARKAQKTQFLPSGDDECLLTKLEIADYFRLEVKIARVLCREGWTLLSNETTPSKSMKNTITLWTK